MQVETTFFWVDSNVCQQFEDCTSGKFEKKWTEETFGANLNKAKFCKNDQFLSKNCLIKRVSNLSLGL